jgi:hypothetical protein
MEEFVPSCEDDVVVLYASAQGRDKDNNLRIIEKSYTINPMKVGKRNLKAIQTSTASVIAEDARLLATGKYIGLIPQIEVPFDELFIDGQFVPVVYK